KTMTINLGDRYDITALQGGIEMPEGVTITNISLAGAQQRDHIVSFAQVDDRCVRFAVYSLSLAKLSGNAPMLEIELDCNRSFLDLNAEVYDIMASDVRSNLLCFDSFGVNISSGDMTGMEEHLSDNGIAGDVYTIQGICVMRDATQKDIDTLAPGIYIVRQGDKVQKIAIY
ncbi:MAG: hypothetical protein K2K88_06940, partial [Muribaculaceae bacterium]|nr:hypothetical protein [Muribaculaceae bacterium]